MGMKIQDLINRYENHVDDIRELMELDPLSPDYWELNREMRWWLSVVYDLKGVLRDE